MALFEEISIILLLIVTVILGSSLAIARVNTNNPGNIVKSNVTWLGSVPCAGRFECFSAPSYGLRALVINLKTYMYVHNLRTVEEIINRWAPSYENDTKAYISFVLTTIGHRPGAKLPITLHNISLLVYSIIKFEKGKVVYNDREIKYAIINIFNIRS